MSFFSDLFEGNFSNLGTDVTHAPESLANNPTELEETLGGVGALATGGLALGGLGALGGAAAGLGDIGAGAAEGAGSGILTGGDALGLSPDVFAAGNAAAGAGGFGDVAAGAETSGIDAINAAAPPITPDAALPSDGPAFNTPDPIATGGNPISGSGDFTIPDATAVTDIGQTPSNLDYYAPDQTAALYPGTDTPAGSALAPPQDVTPSLGQPQNITPSLGNAEPTSSGAGGNLGIGSSSGTGSDASGGDPNASGGSAKAAAAGGGPLDNAQGALSTGA